MNLRFLKNFYSSKKKSLLFYFNFCLLATVNNEYKNYMYKSKFNVKVVHQFCKLLNNDLINVRHNDLTISSVIINLMPMGEAIIGI